MLVSFMKKAVCAAKMVSPKIALRMALCLLSVIAVALGSGMIKDYTILDGDSTYKVSTYADDMSQVLELAGVQLGTNDAADLSDSGSNIITVDRTYSTTVNEDALLAAAKISESVRSYTDELLLGVGAASGGVLSDDSAPGVSMAKRCVVEYTYETVKQTVKFGYKTVYSDQLEKGKSTVTKGKNGEKEIVYKIKRVDGVITESEIESETVTLKATPQIETIGTRRVYSSAAAVKTSEDVKCISTLVPSKPIELDANGIPVSYKNVLTGKATAYYGGTYCATGVKAQPGYVAVNPNQIPYGTKMYIVSADGKYVYGYAVAADTGGFAYNGSGTMVDLRFNTRGECYSFGRRTVNVYILD